MTDKQFRFARTSQCYCLGQRENACSKANCTLRGLQTGCRRVIRASGCFADGLRSPFRLVAACLHKPKAPAKLIVPPSAAPSRPVNFEEIWF